MLSKCENLAKLSSHSKTKNLAQTKISQAFSSKKLATLSVCDPLNFLLSIKNRRAQPVTLLLRKQEQI